MAKSSMVFQAKDRISHSVFGTGTVEEVNSRYTTILFDTEGTRKFITEKVVLAASDTPAPEKPVRRKKATAKAKAKAKAKPKPKAKAKSKAKTKTKAKTKAKTKTKASK